MNLKTYNAQNAPHKVAPKVNRRLTFSFNDKGRFTLGRILYETMGKPAGVEVLQDTQYPTDFYFKASKNPAAFLIKPGSKNQFCFMSNTLAGIIADAIHLPTPPLCGPIQGDGKRGRTVLHRNQAACCQEF